MNKNTVNTSKNKFYVLVGVILLVLITVSSVNAVNIFNVAISICAPSWQCSVYSQETCGTRTCVDVNVCGSNLNKPEELVNCETNTRSSGTGGSSIVNNITLNNSILNGYFLLDKDIIRVSIEQDKLVQKLITLTNHDSESYNLNIIYPTNYNYDKGFITTSSANKIIENKGDFNLVIDSKNIPVGTYVIIANISNSHYSKIVTVIIDVTPKNNPIFDLNLDSKVKLLGVDDSITLYTVIKNDSIRLGDTYLITLLDPKGNILSSETKQIKDVSDITNNVFLPKNLTEGYYTLSFTLIEGKNYTRSIPFTVILPNKYAPVLEMPQKETGYILKLIFGIILGVIICLILSLILLQKKIKNSAKLQGGITFLKLTLPNFKNSAHNSQTSNNSASNTSNDNNEHNSTKHNNKKANAKELLVLKKTYDRGFISLKEYLSALKKRGYTVDSDKITPANALNEEINKIRARHINEQDNIIRTASKEQKEHSVLKEATLAINLSTTSVLDLRVEDHSAFGLQSGEKLYCLRDLLNVLPHMSKHVLDHHVNSTRNDFANWTRDVFHNRVLAQELANAKTKDELLAVLNRRS